MPHSKNFLALAAALAGVLGAASAQAQSWNNASNYNGYGATTLNIPANASLRDPNGNLTLVDGQFRSSNFSSQTGTQFAGAAGGGVGMSGAGVQYGGQASAIGNSLNVVVLGSHNTTVVDTTQINNGNQTAVVDLNGH